MRDKQLEKGCRLKSREIAQVAYLGQITNIWAVAHETFCRSGPELAGILVCAIVRSKNVAISKSHEIARVAYLGQIMIIRSGPAWKS